MKILYRLFLPILLLLSGSVAAQDIFPFKDVNFPSHAQLLREGRAVQWQMPIISTANTGTINFGTAIPGIRLVNTPGRASLVTSISASATGPVQVYASSANIMKVLSATILGQAPTALNAVFGTNGGSATLNPNVLIGSEGGMDLSFKYIGPDSGAKPYVGGSISAIEFTADYHWDAKKVIGIIGESTSWSSMETDSLGIASAGEKLWCFQLADSMRRLGKSVRLVNKAFGSMSSNHMEYARRSGYYDFDYDVLYVNLGINDNGASTSGLGVATPQAVFKANLAGIIRMRNANRPRAPIVFVSCFPTDVSGNISNYRLWMQQVAQDTTVGGGTVNSVYFIDGSTSFALNATATADMNFAVSNRSANNRIHYSEYGQTLNFRLVMNATRLMSWFAKF